MVFADFLIADVVVRPGVIGRQETRVRVPAYHCPEGGDALGGSDEEIRDDFLSAACISCDSEEAIVRPWLSIGGPKVRCNSQARIGVKSLEQYSQGALAPLIAAPLLRRLLPLHGRLCNRPCPRKKQVLSLQSPLRQCGVFVLVLSPRCLLLTIFRDAQKGGIGNLHRACPSRCLSDPASRNSPRK